MSVVELRLIHATTLVTEVAKKMQTPLGFTRLQGMRGIIDINPLFKETLNPFDETDGPPHQRSISHGKETSETTHTAAWHHSIDKFASTSGDPPLPISPKINILKSAKFC